jgi:hypothetical protein
MKKIFPFFRNLKKIVHKISNDKGGGAFSMSYTPPLDFFSFNYLFIETDVRIQDHEIRMRTF